MRSLVLRTTTRLLTPVIAAASLYLLLRGHDAPGGGFIGGLVAGTVIVLRHLAYGTGHEEPTGVTAASMFGAGVIVAAAVGLAGLVFGGSFLEGAIWKTTLPAAGELKVTASLFFDVGVFLVVLGTVAGLVRYLGGDASS